MNYYDYRPYFNDLEQVASDILTAINNNHAALTQQIAAGITLIAALIVVAAAIKVIFK